MILFINVIVIMYVSEKEQKFLKRLINLYHYIKQFFFLQIYRITDVFCDIKYINYSINSKSKFFFIIVTELLNY